jgi:hypothetical protein
MPDSQGWTSAVTSCKASSHWLGMLQRVRRDHYAPVSITLLCKQQGCCAGSSQTWDVSSPFHCVWLLVQVRKVMAEDPAQAKRLLGSLDIRLLPPKAVADLVLELATNTQHKVGRGGVSGLGETASWYRH